MATTREEQKRVTIGAELNKTDTDITNAFGILNGLITRLNNGKTMMQSNPALFDAADIAETDALLNTITAKFTP